jgi:hypothetical protein
MFVETHSRSANVNKNPGELEILRFDYTPRQALVVPLTIVPVLFGSVECAPNLQ